MTEYRPVRGVGRSLASLCFACLGGASLLSGCTDLKQMVGIDQPMPDEFAVESRAPLTVPPEFDLRPPEPGAPRPQEKSADQQAEQVMEQAGPGEPGKQAADFRLRGSASGLPDIGAANGPEPGQNAIVGSQSLSNKLLDYGDTGSAGATLEKRDTTPLKGVY
jgi:Protein of unknown function (DUF3035)